MKPIKVDSLDLRKIIQVGERKFLLMEVENIKDTEAYEVIDAEEKKRLLKALNDTNPILSEEEINELLSL